MFESLTESLQRVFKKVRGQGRLTEDNIAETLREVRFAFLEADVNFQVAKDFIDRLKQRCLGQDVLQSISPGQQVVKLVYDEMVGLLGSDKKDLELNGDPATVMLLGLHGSGKTTTAGKLALRWAKAGRKALLVAGDIRRPAAVEQLTILGRDAGVDVLPPQPGEGLAQLGERALRHARSAGKEIVLFDTGGRFQIDTELVAELKDLRRVVNAQNVLLVIDAALGQESVDVARKFHEEVGLTGLVLTKLDGDARGGAALSVRSITGCPILFTGTGEKLENLEPFYPDRMASRILGMGDVVSLVERAQQAFDTQEVESMQKRLKSKSLNLEDFLEQLRQMKKMGSMESILEMLPIPGGLGAALKGDKSGAIGQMETFSKKAEAIILSMTPGERRNPKVLNGSRRKRIAQGSGTHPSDVNELMRRFEQAKKMSKRLFRMQKGLNMFR